MEHIENPWVRDTTPYDEKPICECDCCGEDMFEGERYFKINDKIYCEECVETGELEAEEPDWDSMPGGYDWRE